MVEIINGNEYAKRWQLQRLVDSTHSPQQSVNKTEEERYIPVRRATREGVQGVQDFRGTLLSDFNANDLSFDLLQMRCKV